MKEEYLHEKMKHLVAVLSKELDTRVTLEWRYSIDPPSVIFPSTMENFNIYAYGYETVHVSCQEHLAHIKIQDFGERRVTDSGDHQS